MPQLPQQWNTSAAADAQWAQTFTFKDSGGLLDLTGLDWEFVIRQSVNDTEPTPLVKVTPTVSAQGLITVNVPAATVQVVLTPAATQLLGRGARAHALWSNPGQTSQLCWVAGRFETSLVADP